MYKYIRALKHLVEESHIIFATHANATQDTRHRVPVFHFVSFRFVPFHSILFCSIPFRSIPFRSIPFRSIPFHSVPFRSVLFHSVRPIRSVRVQCAPMSRHHAINRPVQYAHRPSSPSWATIRGIAPPSPLQQLLYIHMYIISHKNRVMRNKKCIRIIPIFSIVDSFDSFQELHLHINEMIVFLIN